MGECSAYSSLQADSKVKFAAWTTSWRLTGADRLSSRWPNVNSRIWLAPYRQHYNTIVHRINSIIISSSYKQLVLLSFIFSAYLYYLSHCCSVCVSLCRCDDCKFLCEMNYIEVSKWHTDSASWLALVSPHTHSDTHDADQHHNSEHCAEYHVDQLVLGLLVAGGSRHCGHGTSCPARQRFWRRGPHVKAKLRQVEMRVADAAVFQQVSHVCAHAETTGGEKISVQSFVHFAKFLFGNQHGQTCKFKAQGLFYFLRTVDEARCFIEI